MHFRTVKETRKLRGFSDLFMVNRRFIIIIIITIIIVIIIIIIIVIIIICFYFWEAVIKRDTKFLTRYVKGVPLVNRMETKEVPCLSKVIYSETSMKRTIIKLIPLLS